MKQKEEIQELKKLVCQSYKLKFSSLRLLLNGQRLEDSDSVALITIVDGDVIEAFLELCGGGCAYEEYDFSQVDKCSGAESGVFELETN